MTPCGRHQHHRGEALEGTETVPDQPSGQHHRSSILLQGSISGKSAGPGSRGLEDVVLEEVSDIKRDLVKKEGKALSLGYKINVRQKTEQY